MSATNKRPADLPHRAMGGIVEVYLPTEGSDDDSFSSLLARSLDWSKPSSKERGFRILDTFFSDTIDAAHLVALLRSVGPNHPLRILLVDPGSEFAKARGASISQVETAEMQRGLDLIFSCLREVHGSQKIPDVESNSLLERIELLEGLKRFSCLELRFYSEVPSGPLYFYRDLLLSGRFCSGKSARELPWLLLVDDPAVGGDLYSVLSDEFERIWTGARRSADRIVAASPRGSSAAKVEGAKNPPSKESVDIGLVVATECEWDAVKRLSKSWKSVGQGPESQYVLTKIGNGSKSLSLLVVRPLATGYLEAAIATTVMLERFHPQYLAIVGICAGITEEAEIGSIVIPEQVVHGDAGKITGSEFKSNLDVHNLDGPTVRAFQEKVKSLLLKTRLEVSRDLPKATVPALQDKPIIRGVIATVTNVYADAERAAQIAERWRNCHALEMECFGVVKAVSRRAPDERPKCLVIKCVSDKGDKNKSDKFQDYCAHLSVKLFAKAAVEILGR